MISLTGLMHHIEPGEPSPPPFFFSFLDNVHFPLFLHAKLVIFTTTATPPPPFYALGV